MSTNIYHSAFGACGGTRGYPGWVIVGYPLDGRKDLGRVLEYGTHNGWLDFILTKVPCAGAKGNRRFHDMTHRDGRVACRDCDLVLVDPPNRRFHFYPTLSPRGTLACNIDPHDYRSEGILLPFGADTIEKVVALAHAHLRRWIKSFGPKPWFALEHGYAESGLSREVFSLKRVQIPRDDQNGMVFAYAGPFERLEDALRACSQRRDRNTISSDRLPWRDIPQQSSRGAA